MKFSVEEDKWLIENAGAYTRKELVERFNSYFKSNRSECSIKGHCYRVLHIKLQKKNGWQHFYTEQEVQFLRDNVSKYSRKELYKEFCKMFGEVVTENALTTKTKVLGLKHSSNGRFNVGDRGRSLPIGSERYQSNYKSVFVKVKDDVYEKRHDYLKNWRKKEDIIYEQHHGKLPDGTFIVFLDGNRTNYEIENLYPVTPTVHRYCAKNFNWTENIEPRLRLEQIKFAELKALLKEYE